MERRSVFLIDDKHQAAHFMLIAYPTKNPIAGSVQLCTEKLCFDGQVFLRDVNLQ